MSACCASLNSFYLDFWEPLKEKILTHLNRYLVADEVEIHDPNEQWKMLSLQGPRARSDPRESLCQCRSAGASPITMAWFSSTARRSASCAPTAAATMASI